MDAEIPATKKILSDANKEIQTIVAEENNSTGKLMEARGKLEEKRAAMQASSGRGHVLQALMEQKNVGNIPGIFGRLVSFYFTRVVHSLHAFWKGTEMLIS